MYRYGEPAYRHLMGRGSNLIVRVLAIPSFQDTQCGFKSFRRDVARDVFAAQTMTGWAFDVEALFIALRRGYMKVIDVPIYLVFRWRQPGQAVPGYLPHGARCTAESA